MDYHHFVYFFFSFFFFFNDTATTEIYTLSLHDALPIWNSELRRSEPPRGDLSRSGLRRGHWRRRSEEHTSELQSRLHLVCRLLLEKKKKQKKNKSRQKKTIKRHNERVEPFTSIHTLYSN